MPILLDAFDEKANVIVWNSECERVTGYSREEAVLDPGLLERLYPDDAYQEYVIGTLGRNSEDFSGLEFTLTCKDGSRRTISWSNIAAKVPIQGWATWAIGIDVTERKEAELALARSEAKFRQLYENAPVMMHSMDKSGVIRNVNAKWIRELGYHRDEILGLKIDFVLTTESKNVLDRILPSFWDKGEISNLAQQYIREDGNIMDVILDSVVIDDPLWGDISLSVVRDITKSKRSEDAIRNIVAGVSSQIGRKFFDSMVLQFARTLGADFTFIGELVEK
ncbi:PAS domain-containing protein [Thermodesulfobacteriota bacterium]